MNILYFILITFVSICLPLQSPASSIDLMNELIDLRAKKKLPSLSAAYIVNGNVKEIASAGFRRVDFNSRTTINDKFHLGSCTKSMTATLAGKLIEEGYLRWDSTLEELLPEFNISKDFRPVTFDLLLAHRSGLKANSDDFSEGNLTARETRRLISKKLLELPPTFKPKVDFHYSNIGYIVAGYILEKLSDSSWEELMREKLFKPLKMRTCGFGPASTNFEETDNTEPKQPWGHYTVDGISKPIHYDNRPAYGPAATVHCSMQDWGKYLSEHIQGFNKKSTFLTNATFSILHSTYPAVGNKYTYGGWIRVDRSWGRGFVLTHTGTNTYNYANVWIAPKINTVLLATSNIKKNAAEATNQAISNIINRNLKK